MKRAWMMLAVPFLAACGDTPTQSPDVPAPSFDVVRATTPIDLVIGNTCDGEDVHFVGEATTVTHVTSDGAGGYHYVSNRNWKAVGTGLTSGDTYLANFPRNISYLFRGPFPEIYTVTWNNYVTRQGSLGGYLLRAAEKIVVNGDGTVVQSESTTELTCKSD